MTSAVLQAQNARVAIGSGFIAALDRSTDSAEAALAEYGLNQEWSSETELFDAMHDFRVRVMTSPAFDGRRVVGAILFADTLQRTVEDLPTAQWLWERRQIVPFVKVDVGLTDEIRGVQLMRPNPEFSELLRAAKEHDAFGTKMKSVIHAADEVGIRTLVEQQFTQAHEICEFGLTPILEPEVAIAAPDKAEAEVLLRDELRRHLREVDATAPVMLKLSLPEEPNLYREFVHHPKVLKVVALSGGYSQDQACARLALNTGMIASFARALTDGLRVTQSDEEFHQTLDETIATIYDTSRAG